MTPPPRGERSRPLGLAYLALGGLVTAYLVARAILVPLTYDEAATLARYVERDVTAVFDFNVATNHLLNTVLTKLSHGLFGDAPWALRLPSVVGGVVFLFAAAAITRRAAHPLVGLAGFVLMATNPYLLDYFSLSRGYGLATALLVLSVLHLVRWLNMTAETREARGTLKRCLWIGVAAVLASFTVLVAWLAIGTVILARLAWTAWRTPITDAADAEVPLFTWRPAAAWLVIVAAFSATVFSRQEVLSADLFAPISVRIVGLFDEERDLVRVDRETAKGRFRPLERAPDGGWRTGANADAWGLRVELPASVDRNLTSLEVTIGSQVFRRDRRTDGPWQAYDSGSDRVLRSTPALSGPRSRIETVSGAINWVGDAAQWRTAARFTAVVCLLLMALAILWGTALSLMTRLRVLDRNHARLLLWPPLVLSGLIAAPIYLLRRDGQLYFGGLSDLFTDTFGSLVSGTAYESHYAVGVLPIALASLAVAAVILLALAVVAPRLRGALATPGALIVVVLLVSAQVAAQHALTGTPLLMGRTALFLIPLLVLFLATLADAVARSGLASRALAGSLMVLLAAGSVWHVASVANVERTLDWNDDAATPGVIEEVARVAEMATPRAALVRIGVEWMFYPAARYYAARRSTAATTYQVEVLPADGRPPDFIYAHQGSPLARGSIVRAFPQCSAALWQVRPVAETP